MVIVPGRFAFVCTPRTGSRSMAQALARLPGAKQTRIHHVPQNEVPEDGPVYAVLRNPYTQLVSWYKHAGAGKSLEDFAANFVHGRFMYRDTMNIYRSVTDRYFIFELGLQEILGQMGVTNVKVDWIGKSENKPNLSPEVHKIITRRFAQDIELYNKQVAAQGLQELVIDT